MPGEERGLLEVEGRGGVEGGQGVGQKVQRPVGATGAEEAEGVPQVGGGVRMQGGEREGQAGGEGQGAEAGGRVQQEEEGLEVVAGGQVQMEGL